MSPTTLFTAALALAGVLDASPIQKRDGGDTFSVEQVHVAYKLKNGPGQIAQTLQKYGQEVPENIQVAANILAASTGTEPANPSDQYDSAYVCPVVVGNTTLQLDFDTGSSDLWVYSSLQNQSQLAGRNYYKVDPSKQMQGSTWSIKYGDGSTSSGEVYADKVAVGPVTATSQAVEAATSVSSSFLSRKGIDGLLGLAFSSLNQIRPTQQKTFFDTVKPSLAAPLFAVTLKDRAPGSYDFGFINPSKYTGPITYVAADSSRGFWGFQATGYAVGSKTGAATQTTINGIVDTGTTLIYVDKSITDAYYSAFPGAQLNQQAGGYVFPCSSTPPDFSIVVGGVVQTVPGKLINFAPTYAGSSTCFGGIQANTNLGLTIFGDIFLKSRYVVFENSGSTPRLGFAKQA